ncbi:MAG: glucose transporter subunit [Chthoniobacteraceae bacterium]|nr:glucose transporter subunit [Chthoniobacteraceae bacterium]
MTTIADMLKPGNVHLKVQATSGEAAVLEVATLLRNDPEVTDWEKLYAALKLTTPCVSQPGRAFSLCLAHARSSAVTDMVMSVGRSDSGIAFGQCADPARYLFCIGVPVALDADYLRIVGLLARILKAPEVEAQLKEAKTPAGFVEILSRLEAKL